eukprot:12426-Heterococcus_DN1.PRE.2
MSVPGGSGGSSPPSAWSLCLSEASASAADLAAVRAWQAAMMFTGTTAGGAGGAVLARSSTFQRILTAFSVRPGSFAEMNDHLLPTSSCVLVMISSSAGDQAPLSTPVSVVDVIAFRHDRDAYEQQQQQQHGT